MELVGDGRVWRIGRREKPRRLRMRDIEEKNLFLPLEHGEKSSAAEDIAVIREPDVVRLGPARPGTPQRHGRDRPSVAGRVGIEVHDGEKIRSRPRLIAGPDEEVFFLLLMVGAPSLPVRVLPGERGEEKKSCES